MHLGWTLRLPHTPEFGLLGITFSSGPRKRLLPPEYLHSSKFQLFSCNITTQLGAQPLFLKSPPCQAGITGWRFSANSHKTTSQNPFRYSPGALRLLPLLSFCFMGDQTFWNISLPPRNPGNSQYNMTSCLSKLRLGRRNALFHKPPLGCLAAFDVFD